MRINNKALISSIAYIFYGLLVIFLLVYLSSIDYSKLSEAKFHPGYFIVASVIALGFRYWSAYIWTTLLRMLGAAKVRLSRELIYVYAKSWLGRYIPGTAPWILGKIYFASQQGISKNKLAVSSLLEGALQIIVQLTLAITLLSFDTRLDIISPEIRVAAIIALGICLTILAPPVFNKIVSVVYRIFKKKSFPSEHKATTRTIFTGFYLYIVGSILSGLSLFFIAKTVYPELQYDQILFVAGVSTLASAVSMIAIFAPSGIGVREAIQLALLSVIMPTEIALVITIVMRLWSVLMDLIYYFVSLALVRRTNKT